MNNRVPKNDNEFTAFGLCIQKNAHADMRRIKKEHGTPSIHGNKFWKSSYLLMDYLQEYPLERNMKVLELGCGYGLSGIYCAKTFDAKLTSLDADKTVFPYLLHHAALNGVETELWHCRYEQARKVDLQQYDLILGADICFWDSMSSALFNLIRRAKQANEDVRIIFTDPGRPPFREMSERAVERFGADYLDWHVSHPHNMSGLVLDIA